MRIINNEEITYWDYINSKKTDLDDYKDKKTFDKEQDDDFGTSADDTKMYKMELQEYMILDVERQKDGSATTYESPFNILRDKILEAVVKRAAAAFEVLQITKKGLEELEQTL